MKATGPQNIEAAQIDGAALEGAGTSASTNEASTPRSVDPVPRVDGSGTTASLPPEPPPLSVVLVRIPGGHPGGIVFRRYGPRSIGGAGWRVPNIAEAVTYTWAQLHKVGEVAPLVEHTPEFERGIRADELRGAARDMLDRHYELSRVTVATFADWLKMRAARVQVPADGLVKVGRWPTIADAGTAEFDRLWAELEDGPEPVVELDQEIDCCARAAGRHTRGGPDHCGLCGKPFDVPLPPVGDETRGHPGGRPTEGAAGEVSRD